MDFLPQAADSTPPPAVKKQQLKASGCINVLSQFFDWSRVLGTKSVVAARLLYSEAPNSLHCDVEGGRISVKKLNQDKRTRQTRTSHNKKNPSGREGVAYGKKESLAHLMGSKSVTCMLSPRHGKPPRELPQLHELLHVQQEPFVLPDALRERREQLAINSPKVRALLLASQSGQLKQPPSLKKIKLNEGWKHQSDARQPSKGSNNVKSPTQRTRMVQREGVSATSPSQMHLPLKSILSPTKSPSKIISPIKSPIRSPGRRTARLMEAAAKILEPSNRPRKPFPTMRSLLMEVQSEPAIIETKELKELCRTKLDSKSLSSNAPSLVLPKARRERQASSRKAVKQEKGKTSVEVGFKENQKSSSDHVRKLTDGSTHKRQGPRQERDCSSQSKVFPYDRSLNTSMKSSASPSNPSNSRQEQISKSLNDCMKSVASEGSSNRPAEDPSALKQPKGLLLFYGRLFGSAKEKNYKGQADGGSTKDISHKLTEISVLRSFLRRRSSSENSTAGVSHREKLRSNVADGSDDRALPSRSDPVVDVLENPRCVIAATRIREVSEAVSSQASELLLLNKVQGNSSEQGASHRLENSVSPLSGCSDERNVLVSSSGEDDASEKAEISSEGFIRAEGPKHVYGNCVKNESTAKICDIAGNVVQGAEIISSRDDETQFSSGKDVSDSNDNNPCKEGNGDRNEVEVAELHQPHIEASEMDLLLVGGTPCPLRLCNFSWWEQGTRETGHGGESEMVSAHSLSNRDAEFSIILPDSAIPEAWAASPPRTRKVFLNDERGEACNTESSDEFQQSSPVSVLEASFEGEASSLGKSLASFQEAKQQLLEKVRRYELLAQMDLATLEKYVGNSESDQEESSDSVAACDLAEVREAELNTQAQSSHKLFPPGPSEASSIWGRYGEDPFAKDTPNTEEAKLIIQCSNWPSEDTAIEPVSYDDLGMQETPNYWEEGRREGPQSPSFMACDILGRFKKGQRQKCKFFSDCVNEALEAIASKPVVGAHRFVESYAACRELVKGVERPICSWTSEVVNELLERDMRCAKSNWRNFSEELEEIGIELEINIVGVLVHELLDELIEGFCAPC